MKGDPLPDEDSVVRYVGGSKIDGCIIRPEAFGNFPISVNWLEYCSGSKAEQVARVRGVLRLTIGKTAVLAELNVKTISDLGLDVLDDRLAATNGYPAAPCHAEIVDVGDSSKKKHLIFEMLADNIVATHPAHNTRVA